MRKRTWRVEGKHVCRHGVFFNSQPLPKCLCLLPRETADWDDAVLMPVLNARLIITDAFDAHTFERVGCLQAEVRRRGW